ncbi:hypothetical protein EXIGLDRAFT_217226 [Exidia glandulosa HHB12029]|uniref:F-box domain-containing protein n=1 Tax=Exidia glandulosa HHB12029 TaxID=1314781 RepID=A0A165EF45_EXIGL|nr:hypothetical protein EXIGLDRAFT_217226 [Exidia glandulosa HHB12029]
MPVLRRLLCWKTELVYDPPTQSSPAARLPAEILCAVFFLLDFSDRMRTSQVCAHWRGVSISHPGLLWSTVHTRGRRRGAFRRQLERATHVPIAVQIRITQITKSDRNIRELPRISAALAEHMSHVTSLTIHLLIFHNQHLHALVDALRAKPAPLLQTLDLKLCDDGLSRGRPKPKPMIPDDIFACHAPCLTATRLAGTSFLQTAPSALEAVTSLHISLQFGVTPSDVLLRLGTMSRLRDLRLGGSYFPPPLPPTAPAWPHALRGLQLDLSMSVLRRSSIGHFVVSWLCSYLGAANVQNLWIADSCVPATSFDIAFPPDHYNLHARAYLYENWITRGIEVMRCDGKYRCVQTYWPKVDVPALILDYLTDVTIDEEYLILRTSSSTISLPRAVRLAIVLMESPQHYNYYDEDDDLLNDINLQHNDDLERKTATLLLCVSHHSCLALHTPLLEEVNIHAVPAGDVSKPLAVGPEEILALLSHIDRRDTTLTRLAVSGAELVTHVPALLSRLFEVAESVTVDPEYIETVRVQGAPDFIGSPLGV